MKTKVITILAVVFFAASFTSCEEEEITPQLDGGSASTQVNPLYTPITNSGNASAQVNPLYTPLTNGGTNAMH